MAETEQAGTPNPTPDDATGGTPVTGTDGGTTVDWEARAREAERKFEQSLLEKEHLEAERRRRRELEEENERLRSGGYGTAPAHAGSPHAQAAEEMRAYYTQLQNSDEPGAKLLLANLNYTQRLEAQMRFRDELASIPATEQAAVEKRAVELGVRPTLAYQALKGERYDKESAEIAERRRKLDEDEAARRKGRVDTSTVPIPGRDLQTGDMTPKEFEELCSRAERGDSTARGRLRDFDEGRAHIKYG
jgi:hypothetical protein